MGFLSEREANKKKAAAQREADMADAPDLMPAKPASGLMADRKASAAKAEAERKAQMASAPDIGPKRPAAGIMAERNDSAKRAEDKRKAQMADAPNIGPASPESYLADRSFNAASDEATRKAQMADATDLLPYVQIAIDKLTRDPLTPQAKAQLASLNEFRTNLEAGLKDASTSIKDSNARIGNGFVKKITDTIDKTPLVDGKTKETLNSISRADTTFKDASAEIGQVLATSLNSMKDSAAKEVADAIIAVAPAAAVSAPILAAAPYLRAAVRNHFQPIIYEAGANPSGDPLPVDAKGMSKASGKPISTKIANPVAPDAGLENINPKGMSKASGKPVTTKIADTPYLAPDKNLENIDPKGMSEARASKGLMKPAAPEFPNTSPEAYYKNEAARINPTETPAKPVSPAETPTSSKGVNSADYYKPEAKSIAGDTKPGLMKPPVEASVAAEAPAASSEAPKFMITKADKVALNNLGYSIEEIRQMTPKEAQTIINKGVVNAGSQINKATSFVNSNSAASAAPAEAPAESAKKPFFTKNPPVTSNTTLWKDPPITAGANEARDIPTSAQQMKMTEGSPKPANVNTEGSTLRSATAANSNTPGVAERPPTGAVKSGPSFPEMGNGNAFERGRGLMTQAPSVLDRWLPLIKGAARIGGAPAAVVAELYNSGNLNEGEMSELSSMMKSGELDRLMKLPIGEASGEKYGPPGSSRVIRPDEFVPEPGKPVDNFRGPAVGKQTDVVEPEVRQYLASAVRAMTESPPELEALSRGVSLDTVVTERANAAKGLMAPPPESQIASPVPEATTPTPRPEPQAAPLKPEPQAATPSPEPSAAKLPPPRTAQEGAAAATPAATRPDIAPIAPFSTPPADTAPTVPVQSNPTTTATPVAAPMQMPTPGPSQGTPAATPAPSNAPRQMPMPDNRPISVDQASKSFTEDNPRPYGDQYANLQTMLEAMADGSFGGGRVEAFRLNGMNFTFDPSMPSKYRITK